MEGMAGEDNPLFGGFGASDVEDDLEENPLFGGFKTSLTVITEELDAEREVESSVERKSTDHSEVYEAKPAASSISAASTKIEDEKELQPQDNEKSPQQVAPEKRLSRLSSLKKIVRLSKKNSAKDFDREEKGEEEYEFPEERRTLGSKRSSLMALFKGN
jgi:hypothetical protein